MAQLVDFLVQLWISASRLAIRVENPPPPEQKATMIAIRIRHQEALGGGGGSIS
jgi:hypothetical protein